MTMVSSYFAQVGVQLDTRSLRSTQAYFKNIERIMTNFQRRATRVQAVNLKFKIDRAVINKQLQQTMNRLSNNVIVPIKRFDINKKSLVRAINNAIPADAMKSGSVRIGLRISRSSLTHMRDQVRQALEGTVIRPKINPNVMRGRVGGYTDSGGSRGRSDGGKHLDPRNTSRQSPWHNPMMMGGGLGAFMRYGFFSLPAVGGVMGLNALSNYAGMQAAQRTSLDAVATMGGTTTGEEGRQYLTGLSERTGKKVASLTPIYTQMMAASQGTELAPQLNDMFSGIVGYASIMGIGDESLKRAMTGFQQMIGKRTIMAEELKGQVGEHIPTVIPLMAQAMGMDVKTLFKTMEKGELDPMKALPKLAKLMAEMSAPAMAKYMQSLPYFQGMSQVRSEQYMTKFNQSGGEAGLTTFWKTWQHIIHQSIDSAEHLGRIFERIAKDFSGALLIPQELQRWINGETDVRNFWQSLFGGFEDFTELQDVITQTNILKQNLNIDSDSLVSLKSTLKEIDAILVGINSILTSVNTGIGGLRAFRQDGVSGYFKYTAEEKDVATAEKMAKAQLEVENPNYTPADLAALTSLIFTTVQSNRESSLIPRFLQNDLEDAPEKWLGSRNPTLGFAGGVTGDWGGASGGWGAGKNLPSLPKTTGDIISQVAKGNSNTPQNNYSGGPLPLNKENVNTTPVNYVDTLIIQAPDGEAGSIVESIRRFFSGDLSEANIQSPKVPQ